MNKPFKTATARLRHALEAQQEHRSLRQVALAAGQKPQTLSNALRRDSISVDLAKALEPVLQRNWQWLYDGSGPELLIVGAQLSGTPTDARVIPLLSLEMAATKRTNDGGDGDMGKLMVDGPTTEGLAAEAFAITVDDDSMRNNTPESVQRGDIAVIDPKIPPQPGDLVVARVDGMARAFFRKYREVGLDSSGKLIVELVPLNPDFAPLTIDNDRPGEIIGVMVEHRRMRRAARG